MKRLLLSALLLGGCARVDAPAERYGLVSRLGRDTVSLESITRRGNSVVVDGVDRFPAVRQRHTEVTLRDDGSIERLVMDIHTPSDSATRRDRHVVADVRRDSVIIVKRDGTGSMRWAFATNGGVPMAHVPQMYSLYELYFQAARRRADSLHRGPGDTVMMRQFYIDREFDRFPMNHGVVRLLAGNKAEIEHDWLSGTGAATFDSSGHLVHYSGARTTYLVEVDRLADQPDVKAVGERFAALEAKQGGAKSLSVRDTVRATIGTATFTVDYGRPLARGRTLVGGVIPYDAVWRTGANAATQLTTSAPITLGTLQVPAGKYTLWTVPRRDGVELVVNSQSGQWGTSYDRSRDLGRTPMTTEAATAPVEQFTIAIEGKDARSGTLALAWGDFRWTVPIVVR